MAVPHYMASGMGGIGDLVARMEYNSNMKVDKAKEYVAKKLGISTLEIADECIMRELREELKIGTVTAVPGVPRGIAAKMNIEKLLDIKINSRNAQLSPLNYFFRGAKPPTYFPEK